MTDNLKKEIIDIDLTSAKFINLYSILCNERFILEFLEEVVKEKYDNYGYYVKESDFSNYMETKSEQSKVIESWTVEGKKKMLVKVKNFLTEGGYLEKNKDGYKIYNKNVRQNNTLKMIEIYKQMMKKVNIEIKDTAYDVPVSKDSERNVKKFLDENNVSEKIIALNFFGASRGRKINEEVALVIIRRLSEMYRDHRIIILDSPNDRETIYNILEKTDNKNILFFEKSRTVLDSISIIKNSDLVVSLDTAILHIAEGLNKKIMAFYGLKINKNKWRIKEEGNILVDYTEKRINDVDFEKVFDKLNHKDM